MTEETSRKKILEISVSNMDKLGNLVKLSEELNTYLARMGAQISLRFDPATQAPLVEVVSADGKRICPASEFKKISGYRKFLGDILKEKELESSSKAKIEIIANLRRHAGGNLPEKIIQENHQKLIQMRADMDNLAGNAEKIKALLSSDFKEYLLEIHGRIDVILSELMTKLVSNEKVTNEERDEALLKAAIPKWIYGRFLQKDWIKNETEEAKSLLFPKGNFLKGVALSLKEIQEQGFVEMNHKITSASRILFELIKTQPIVEFITVSSTDAATVEALEKEREKFQWTLIDPNPDDIFLPRKLGKNPPTIMVEKPKPMGKGKQVTALAKLRSDQRNRLRMVSDHLQLIVHGAIMLSDPVEQFWSKILTGTDSWTVTPEKTIFDWIEDDPNNLAVFKSLGNPSPKVLSCMLELLFMKIGLLMKTGDVKKLVISLATPFAALPAQKFSGLRGLGYMDILDTSLLTKSDLEEAKTFLGQKPKKFRASKPRGQAKALEKSVKSLITDSDIAKLNDIQTEVLDWISRNFTSKAPDVRELAAELIVGAFERQEDLAFGEGTDSDSESQSED